MYGERVTITRPGRPGVHDGATFTPADDLTVVADLRCDAQEIREVFIRPDGQPETRLEAQVFPTPADWDAAEFAEVALEDVAEITYTGGNVRRGRVREEVGNGPRVPRELSGLMDE